MRKRILIIDDNKETRLVLNEQLSFEDFELEAIGEPLDGLERARAWKPDLIMLDVMMPKMDGFRLCRLLKFDDNCKDIPIIMLTALFSDQKREEGKAAGADAYIVKPFELEKHMKIVKDLL